MALGFFTGRMFAQVMARRVVKDVEVLKAAPKGKPNLMEDEVPGLGKNFLRSKRLAAAIAAYEDYLVFFLLRTYADRPSEAWSAEIKALVPVMFSALGIEGDVKVYLGDQLERRHEFKDALETSLHRDDKRGQQIFDDYAEFHDAPENDSTLAGVEKEVKGLLANLEPILRSAAKGSTANAAVVRQA